MSDEKAPSLAEDRPADERLYNGSVPPEGVSFCAAMEGWSVPKVFVAIRDRRLMDWRSICAMFQVNPEWHDTRWNRLRSTLALLKAAGLVEYDEPPRHDDDISSDVRVSPRAIYVQWALNISMTGLASAVPGKSLFVTPPFELRKTDVRYDVFAMMPFASNFDELYEEVLCPVVTGLNLSIARADDLFGPESIVNDIWTSIVSAQLLIADCTTRNPNVFYEIGLAHAIGKKVILLAQSDADVPFDLRHLRYISYSLTPRGVKQLSTSLEQTINALLRTDVDGK